MRRDQRRALERRPGNRPGRRVLIACEGAKTEPAYFNQLKRDLRAAGVERPIYARTAAFGHFDREPERDGGFSW